MLLPTHQRQLHQKCTKIYIALQKLLAVDIVCPLVG